MEREPLTSTALEELETNPNRQRQHPEIEALKNKALVAFKSGWGDLGRDYLFEAIDLSQKKGVAFPQKEVEAIMQGRAPSANEGELSSGINSSASEEFLTGLVDDIRHEVNALGAINANSDTANTADTQGQQEMFETERGNLVAIIRLRLQLLRIYEQMHAGNPRARAA